MTSGSQPAGPQGIRAVEWWPTGLGLLGFENGARTSRSEAHPGTLPPTHTHPVIHLLPACDRHCPLSVSTAWSGLWVDKNTASWGIMVGLQDSSRYHCCFRNAKQLVSFTQESRECLFPEENGFSHEPLGSRPHAVCPCSEVPSR